MSQSIEMFENLPPQDCTQTESESTLSQRVFPASLIAWLESALRKMTGATCGENAKESFAKFSPDGRCLKTCLGFLVQILDGSFEEFSGPLPRQGMMRAGSLMPLPKRDHRNNATECLSWPAPHANCHTGAGERGEGGINIQTAVKQWPTPNICGNYNRKGVSATSGDGLATAVSMWPTPTVPNGGRSPKGGMSMTGMTPDGKKRQVDLQYAVRNWPTPRSSDGEHGGPNQRDSKGAYALPGAVHHWPTPAAQDAKNATLPPSQKNRDTIPGAVMRQGHTGSLNSDFVEILMGYNIGWTDIDCDDPQPWPGWPAGQGEYQYDYEPPRVIQGQKNRAKRLKCLGNSVCAQQVYPIFKAIMEMEEVQG